MYDSNVKKFALILTSTGKMKPSTLIEIISASADTRWINGPFNERGGFMIVAPPGNLKSTIIESAVDYRADTIMLSNINAQQWGKIKADFTSNRLTAIAFPELEAIYKRARATAEHVEAIIQSITAEGYTHGPGQDPRMPRLKARAIVIGGITDDCYERRYDEWKRSGFLRRIIWCLVSVDNPEKIIEAIRDWKKIDFGKIIEKPATGTIAMDLGSTDSRKLERMMKNQPGANGTGYVLLKKITAVLIWKHGKRRAWELLDEFAPSLGKNGCYIHL